MRAWLHSQLLDNAAKKLETTELADQPAHRAKLQGTLGRTYHALGLYRQAIPLQEQVRDYHLATSGPKHPDTLMAMGNKKPDDKELIRFRAEAEELLGVKEETNKTKPQTEKSEKKKAPTGLEETAP